MMKYFSKWRNEWVEFHTTPTRGELLNLQRHHYRIAVDGIEADIETLIKSTKLHA